MAPLTIFLCHSNTATLNLTWGQTQTLLSLCTCTGKSMCMHHCPVQYLTLLCASVSFHSAMLLRSQMLWQQIVSLIFLPCLSICLFILLSTLLWTHQINGRGWQRIRLGAHYRDNLFRRLLFYLILSDSARQWHHKSRGPSQLNLFCQAAAL